MTDLLVVVPIRRRRAKLERFLESMEATRQGETDLLLVSDDDDTSYDDLTLPPWATRVVMEHTNCVSKKVNAYAVPAADEYPFVMNTGDDNVFVTEGWDVKLLEPLRAKPGYAYPDNKRRTDIPETVVISSQIIKALGWFQEPSMCHFYLDNAMADIGNALGCLHFVPEVVIRHLHYSVDPGTSRDWTYAESEVHGSRDLAAYLTWQRERMAADIETVKAVL